MVRMIIIMVMEIYKNIFVNENLKSIQMDFLYVTLLPNSCVVATLSGSETEVSSKHPLPCTRTLVLGFQTSERAGQNFIKLIIEFREVEPMMDRSASCNH